MNEQKLKIETGKTISHNKTALFFFKKPQNFHQKYRKKINSSHPHQAPMDHNQLYCHKMVRILKITMYLDITH